MNSNVCEPSSAPFTSASQSIAVARTEVRCCAASPGFFLFAANVLDAHRASDDDGQTQRAAQDLPAAFAVGTVDDEKVRHLLNLSDLKDDPENRIICLAMRYKALVQEKSQQYVQNLYRCATKSNRVR